MGIAITILTKFAQSKHDPTSHSSHKYSKTWEEVETMPNMHTYARNKVTIKLHIQSHYEYEYFHMKLYLDLKLDNLYMLHIQKYFNFEVSSLSTKAHRQGVWNNKKISNIWEILCATPSFFPTRIVIF